MKCGKCETYTMKTECCGQKTAKAGPAKYSPHDQYARYRRAAKSDQLREEGLI